MQRAKTCPCTGFYIAPVEFFVELIELSRLCAACGCRVPKVRVQSIEIFRQPLPLHVSESGGAACGETLQLGDDLQQLLNIFPGERSDRHSRLMCGRGCHVPFSLKPLKCGANRRSA